MVYMHEQLPATVAGYALWALLTAILGGMSVGTALGVRQLKRRKSLERN